MKKLIALVLATVMAVALIGCKNEAETVTTSKNEENELEVSSEKTTEKIYWHNGKEYKASELSLETIRWFEMDTMERSASSYYPPEFAEDIVG